MTAPLASTSQPGTSAASTAATSVLLQLGGAALLGMVVLYGVAFAESPLAHNAAHDVRHVTVKPCH
ncbi:MAG: CbtB-domain containing protein [Comamonadaceae bacterium]|nr:MAG: CbtB-domain containing protein [Comamonadaceae bacterium]